MEKKLEILESRKRLDQTLSLPDLVNEGSIASLVKEKYMQSSIGMDDDSIGKIVEIRTKEVTNFLDMLRSASKQENNTSSSPSNSCKDWKVKQDTDQLRVMYREGPHGSPYHTLLAEGFANGPMDVCLCVSWESTLYRKWWPQYSVPTFKIVVSSRLQKVQIGEEIFLMRMKVPWPVSDREVVLHYFEIEYFKEDLLLILIKSISDMEHVNVSTHGFSRDGIPDAKDTIRMDLVGGFVMQKVKSDRCYFRVIANLDIKLDFVPPWLINFISRQLIGSGHKLYQKAVGSVAATDEDYHKALQDPLYVRIHRYLDSCDRPAKSLEDLERSHHAVEPKTSVPEITEEENEHKLAVEDNFILNDSPKNVLFDDQKLSSDEQAWISTEVKRAINVLDQAINVIRAQAICTENHTKCSSTGEHLPSSEILSKTSMVNDVDESGRSKEFELAKNPEGNPTAEDYRESNPGSSIREDFDVRGPTSLRTDLFSGSHDSRVVESSSFHEKLPSKANVTVMQPPIMDTIGKVCDEGSLIINGISSSTGGHYAGKSKQSGKKKGSFCCFMLGIE